MTAISSDHRINDFPGFDDADWVFKGQHARKYRQLGAGKTRVVSVYTGLFLEILISPFRTYPRCLYLSVANYTLLQLALTPPT